MLLSLQIENYAIIKSLNMTFDSGFTVITGETGAGKSILIGALSLILGNRVDNSVLYDRTHKCIVEGVFDIHKLDLNSFFEENELDYADHTILRREISISGKSRAFINDTPVSLALLKELAEHLVDIHSQHQHLLLANHDFRIRILDDYAQNGALLEQYQAQYKQHQQVTALLSRLIEEQEKAAQEHDYHTFLLQELETANLREGEQEELEQQIKRLTHAETIKDRLYRSTQLLERDQFSILSILRDLKSELSHIVEIDPRYQELWSRVESVHIELKDLESEITALGQEVEVNPELLAQLNERLDLLNRLQLKHKVNSERELMERQAELQGWVLQFVDMESQVAAKQKELLNIKGLLESSAKQLSEKRKAASPLVEKEIKNNIQLLGMEEATFKVTVQNSSHLGLLGNDQVQFLFSANRGGPVLEVEKIASGGEISRLMLAIKYVITSTNYLPTVIFDEIDTGVSGDIAGKVARLMTKIAQERQLLVITHLPQIAAKANLHYFVYKKIEGDQTYTHIKLLNNQERVEEIATLISAEKVTDAARQTAQLLIDEP